MFGTPRHELKYLISNQDALVLMSRLSHVLHADVHSHGNGGYEVTSLYFDTPYFSCAAEKEEGIYSRTKYRLRTYDAGGVYMLEKKAKRGNVCFKTRYGVDAVTASTLCGGVTSSDAAVHPLLATMAAHRRSGALQPAVIVRYIRRAFCGEPGRVRITFDTDLCAIRADAVSSGTPLFYTPVTPAIPVLPRNFHILEVKYDFYLPDAIRKLLVLASRPTQALSKYNICLKAMMLH